jgi:hypothetical protein
MQFNAMAPVIDLPEPDFRLWLIKNWPYQASLQFSIPKGTFTDDTPNTNSVTWAGVIVEYNGNQYTITDGNTSDKWLYWTLASPTTIQHAATMPAITADLIIVGVNVAGVFSSGWKSGQGVQAEMVAGTVIADEVIAGAIDGMTITGALIQTESTADRGIKLTSDSLTAWNTSGDVRVELLTSGLTAGIFRIYKITGLENTSSIIFGDGVILIGGDVQIGTAGEGVILTNAAGTVTKRVRLNDAGDGLIYEAP